MFKDQGNGISPDFPSDLRVPFGKFSKPMKEPLDPIIPCAGTKKTRLLTKNPMG